ncbi:MAG: alpha-hydroxy-acid oxidizing enzyme [Acidimicrobiales bacterium]|nr:MAG: alpha-hydroxy-acid oxidizing enzyme [Acidimicrobiales bacterium]
MANPWFETVAVAQERAKKRIPKSVYGALIAGAEAGLSMRDNVSAFDEIGFRPVTAGQAAERQMDVTIMGQPASIPVMISPTGVQAVHPHGEVAVARAAANRGIPVGLSSFASKPIEEVSEANDNLSFQIYWAGDRDSMLARIGRAKAAGAKGLILTLDWSFSHGRDWGSPAIPQSFSVKELAPHALDVIARPRWAWSWVKAGQIPRLRVPNFVTGDDTPPLFFEAYGTWMGTPPPTWDDVAWLRSQWDGPFMVKGVVRADEARRAVDAGASAISVSNHGGNNVDGAPASIRVLPEIAAAVGDDVEVLLDGGVRRGSDVVKALALGADAVLIGRAYLWGLAANGQAGVENVLDILRGGIDATMRGIGVDKVGDLSAADVIVPDGFSPPPA